MLVSWACRCLSYFTICSTAPGAGSSAGAATRSGSAYRTESQLDQYDRPADDPIIERLLLAAIRRINPAVQTDAEAGKAVELLRGMLSDPDPLAANRRTLDAPRDGVPVVVEPGQPAVTVQFFEFDPEHQDRITFVITNQYSVKGTATSSSRPIKPGSGYWCDPTARSTPIMFAVSKRRRRSYSRHLRT